MIDITEVEKMLVNRGTFYRKCHNVCAVSFTLSDGKEHNAFFDEVELSEEFENLLSSKNAIFERHHFAAPVEPERLWFDNNRNPDDDQQDIFNQKLISPKGYGLRGKFLYWHQLLKDIKQRGNVYMVRFEKNGVNYCFFVDGPMFGIKWFPVTFEMKLYSLPPTVSALEDITEPLKGKLEYIGSVSGLIKILEIEK